MGFRVEGDEEGNNLYDDFYHLDLEFMGSCITEEEYNIRYIELLKKREAYINSMEIEDCLKGDNNAN